MTVKDGLSIYIWVSQRNLSLLHQLNLEDGFSRCQLDNQQSSTNICTINHTEEHSHHQVQVDVVLKMVFVRLHLPFESTLRHSLEKPLPPLTRNLQSRDSRLSTCSSEAILVAKIRLGINLPSFHLVHLGGCCLNLLFSCWFHHCFY